jgi:hypothetical protein
MICQKESFVRRNLIKVFSWFFSRVAASYFQIFFFSGWKLIKTFCPFCKFNFNLIFRAKKCVTQLFMPHPLVLILNSFSYQIQFSWEEFRSVRSRKAKKNTFHVTWIVKKWTSREDE